ncbi:MAG: undecaprenyldiphospho-muramoylpentapeptide beta-N-acetylglucosaminyltransferase [Bacillota bacterium]|nr:undecaprenyldiphospho-muramoylpentapeptide beta-N-acetylglucosaminyltransferase [Bacillota bacterium]
MRKLRAMFAAGGTGGHIYPAVAVAKEFVARHPDAEILFVGSKRGMENQIVPAEGFRLVTLDLTYFSRRPSFEQVKAAFRAAKAIVQAVRLLKRFSPDVVVGTGGYAAGPMMFAAGLMGYPTIIHEQNAFPSLTNRWLARLVDKIAVSHEAAGSHFPQEKVHVTGNPLRPAILVADRFEARRFLGVNSQKIVLLVVGGSGGALRLNQTVCDAYGELLKLGVHLVHVTGKKYYSEVSAKASVFGDTSLNVVDYAINMPELLAAADLVISRSGSFTAELAALGKPSILIPSPIAANDHQLHNARVVENAGGAVVITENSLSSQVLIDTVRGLITNHEALAEMAQKSRSLAFPHATASICNLVDELIE